MGGQAARNLTVTDLASIAGVPADLPPAVALAIPHETAFASPAHILQAELESRVRESFGGRVQEDRAPVPARMAMIGALALASWAVIGAGVFFILI